MLHSSGFKVSCEDDVQRALLFDLDMAIVRLTQDTTPGHESLVSRTGTYHNLMRMWAQT